MRSALRCIVAAMLVFALDVEAQPARDSIAERVKACAACHGKQGEGLTKAEYYPRLAGKPAGYLFNQLVAFRDGRRTSPIMNYLTAHLADPYLLEMSRYYEGLKPPYPPAVPAPADTVARGRELATQGDASRKLPACTSCHGERLTGTQPAIPGLVGLSNHYVASQMGAWRIGLRRAAEPDCMREIATALSVEDTAAISAWLATLPASPEQGAAPKPSAQLPMKCGAQ